MFANEMITTHDIRPEIQRKSINIMTFLQVDADHDGRIDYEEFCAHLVDKL